MIVPLVVAISYSCIGRFSVFSMESEKIQQIHGLANCMLLGINLALVTVRVRNDDFSPAKSLWSQASSITYTKRCS